MSNNDRAELGRLVGEASREATRASAELDEAVSLFMGVNGTDARACDVLDHYGQLTAGELAGHLGLTTGTVTTVVDRLEKAGMVERLRDPSDRRKVVISITAEARALFAAVYTPFKAEWVAASAALTTDDLRAALAFQRMSRDLNATFAARLRAAGPPKGATLAERTDAASEALRR